MASTQPEVLPRLDEEAFRHFAPLLAASQDYAHLSGCRFRNSSFNGLPEGGGAEASEVPVVAAARATDRGPRLAAKLRAAPVVREFSERVRAGEPALVEEVERAFRIVMAESVRNAMMGMFNALDMFPPSPAPAGVEDEDCSYEDVTEPLPKIAQRLYNDQVRRLTDTTGSCGRLEQRAMTAAFIVDFADGVGMQLPATPETQQGMLREFAAKAAELSRARSSEAQQSTPAREAFLNGFGMGAAADGLRNEVKKWWGENWQSAVWAAAGAAVFGAAAIAGTALMRSAQRQRDESPRRR